LVLSVAARAPEDAPPDTPPPPASAPPTTAHASAPPTTARATAPPTTAHASAPPTTARATAPPTTAPPLFVEAGIALFATEASLPGPSAGGAVSIGLARGRSALALELAGEAPR